MVPPARSIGGSGNTGVRVGRPWPGRSTAPGLARTIVPSMRITTDDAALEAVDLDHIVLSVSDLDRASSH